jgi:hypothetical protein
LGEFVALDEDHEDDSALPDRLPAGLYVGRAGEKAVQAGDAAQEIPIGGEAFCRSLKLGGKDLDRCRRHVCRGGTITPGSIPQSQETNGDDGQSPEQRHQPIRLI